MIILIDKTFLLTPSPVSLLQCSMHIVFFFFFLSLMDITICGGLTKLVSIMRSLCSSFLFLLWGWNLVLVSSN